MGLRERKSTYKVREHSLPASHNNEEEKELDNLGQLRKKRVSGRQLQNRKDTDSTGIRSTALRCIVRIIKFVYIAEYYDPASVCTRCIQGRFEGIFHGVVEFYLGFHTFRYVAPGCRYEIAHNDRDNVDNHRKIPGDYDISCGPDQPSLYVLVDVAAMLRRVRFVPVEMDEKSRRDYQSGQES